MRDPIFTPCDSGPAHLAAGATMSRIRTVVLCLTLQIPVAVRAQGGALPVEPRLLGSGVDTLAVFLVRGSDTARTGVIIDNWRSDAGQLVRVYTTVDRALGNGVDTIVSSITDLQPVSYSTRSSLRFADLLFVPLHVQGWVRPPNGDSTGISVTLPSVVYDGASFDLVVRASPLREGLQLAVPSFIVGPNTVMTLTGTVTGSEGVDGLDCWVVKADFGGLPVTFWVDKHSRRLRRQVMQPRVGMEILFAHVGTARQSRAT